jgi:hypothetical protein
MSSNLHIKKFKMVQLGHQFLVPKSMVTSVDYPEDGGSKLFRNVGTELTFDMV